MQQLTLLPIETSHFGHSLTRSGRTYRCSICEWQWSKKPCSPCPGILRVEWNSSSRPGLMTAGEWGAHGRTLIDGACPIACIAVHNFRDWIWLYEENQTERQHSRHLTKSKIAEIYRLSPGWFARLGQADAILPNPYRNSGSPIQLFDQQRVEMFLAEHEEEYKNWLQRRAKLSESSKVTAAARRRREQQAKDCACCSSSCIVIQSFFCAIYPFGPTELPCPDWQRRH